MGQAADELVPRLRAERELAQAQRATRATDVSLDRAIEHLSRIQGHLADGSSLGTLPEQLAHLVTDSWDWGAELTSDVLRFTQGLGPGADGLAAVGDPRDDPGSSPPPGVWPAWVRYLVLTALVAVIGTGLVVAVYDKGFLPIAGPFVAMFVGPFLAAVGLWWYLTRSDRAALRVAESLTSLIPALEEELARPMATRPSRAGDDALEAAVRRARTATSQLSYGDHAQAVGSLAQLRKVTAEWGAAPLIDRHLRQIDAQACTIEAGLRRLARD